MQRPSASKSGFTIIELIVAIVVIGIIASIVVISYSGIQRQSRDASRDGHIAEIKVALQKYYADHSEYPAVCSASGIPCEITDLSGELGAYLDVVQHDPSWNEGAGTDYEYVAGPDGNSFGLKVPYEQQNECVTGKNLDENWWGDDVPACGNETFVTTVP